MKCLYCKRMILDYDSNKGHHEWCAELSYIARRELIIERRQIKLKL